MKVYLFIVAGLLWTVSQCQALVITVDDDGIADFDNLQSAIEAATEGDTILVSNGVYSGGNNYNIYLDKSITLESANGPENCIINCQLSDDCFAFNIDSCDPVIDGFTITQCSKPDSEVAIFITNSNAVIKQCIFNGNAGCVYCIPGGYYLEDPKHAKVVNCTFYGNTAGEESGAVGMSMNSHMGGSLTVSNSIFWANEPNDIDFDFHMCKSGSHPGMLVEFSMLQTTWQDEWQLTFENCIYEQDPLFADPVNNDFHLQSQAGRWDSGINEWVADSGHSLGIDAGDPNDDGWENETYPHGELINLGAYGGTWQASLSLQESDCLKRTADFYDDWMAFGKPDCWCYSRQCRGDADGMNQGNKCGSWAVGTIDLDIFLPVFQVYEPPAGTGVAITAEGICADFDHKKQCNKRGCWRVGTKDLDILLRNWQILDQPGGPGVEDCSVDDYNYWVQ